MGRGVGVAGQVPPRRRQPHRRWMCRPLLGPGVLGAGPAPGKAAAVAWMRGPGTPEWSSGAKEADKASSGRGLSRAAMPGGIAGGAGVHGDLVPAGSGGPCCRAPSVPGRGRCRGDAAGSGSGWLQSRGLAGCTHGGPAGKVLCCPGCRGGAARTAGKVLCAAGGRSGSRAGHASPQSPRPRRQRLRRACPKSWRRMARFGPPGVGGPATPVAGRGGHHPTPRCGGRGLGRGPWRGPPVLPRMSGGGMAWGSGRERSGTLRL
jgi:hypothetical protein